MFEPSLDSVLKRLGETEDLLLGVYIYTGPGLLTILFDYRRDIPSAIFEIHGLNLYGANLATRYDIVNGS
jgi:hypothetical protein